MPDNLEVDKTIKALNKSMFNWKEIKAATVQ